METSRGAVRLTASVCLLALAACSGGGGGGASLNTTTPTNNTSSSGTSGTSTSGTSTSGTSTSGTSMSGSSTSGSSSSSTSGSTIAINAPSMPSAGGISSPSFNFTTNLPPVGTVFNLPGSVLAISPTSVNGAGSGQGVSATFRGTVNSGSTVYPVFDLDVPVLSLHATNLRGDGTSVTLADGSKASAIVATLNYTLLGAWTYSPVTGPSYIGQAVTGSLAPVSGIPSTGSATYSGGGSSGGVVGAFAVPSGSGTIQAGALIGNVSLTVNFASNTASGTLSNMSANTTANGSGTTPWNTVTLSGTLTRDSTSGSLSGSTSTGGSPSGAGNAGFSSAATGNFAAALYGPTAQEVGGTWTLHEGSGSSGRTAVGTFAGSR